MTKLQELLAILLGEMVNYEKNSIREFIVDSLSESGLFSKDEIDVQRTYVKSEDESRYYVCLFMKKGTRLTMPLQKKPSNKRIGLLTETSSRLFS